MEFKMIRSIRGTPEVLDSALKALKEWNPPEKGFRRIIFIGCGSSYFSSLAGNHVLLKGSRVESHAFPASEFMLHYRELAKDALVVASSRSGKTGEVIEAIKVAKKKSATIIGVTCNENSKIEEISDETIVIPSGEEPNIPATKSFSSITFVLQGIAVKLLEREDKLKELEAIKPTVKKILAQEDEYRPIAERLVSKRVFVHLGSGSGYVVALEGALKFRETLGLPNEVFPALEFRHGPVALLRGVKGLQPILIAPKGDSTDALKRLVNDLASRNADPLVFTNSGIFENCVRIPWDGSEELAVIPFVVPIQIIAYYLAVLSGLNPDFPEGLVKVVERF
ncbi:hypothetical protein X802_05755 [Thermococcus guaymasensis DSM 11113]|uniref:SIS domain-containing protein n=2 Tax=Thermococcus guaymasensis TaxID=110164 RepID=A0A0X1KN72_9EURY|nr:hypothetical protein X802_05755 [Thermococcus guaymasensis DSM 11113]